MKAGDKVYMSEGAPFTYTDTGDQDIVNGWAAETAKILAIHEGVALLRAPNNLDDIMIRVSDLQPAINTTITLANGRKVKLSEESYRALANGIKS